MTLPLRDIPNGTAVLVDANIVVNALDPNARHHAVCAHLLERGARGTLALHLSVATAADVIHRAMVLELLTHGTVQTSAAAVTYLKRHPSAVQQLTRYRTVLRDLTQARVNILPVSYRDLHAGRQARERDGLLANDSLLVAVMRPERLRYRATNDADFERIAGITVCLPD